MAPCSLQILITTNIKSYFSCFFFFRLLLTIFSLLKNVVIETETARSQFEFGILAECFPAFLWELSQTELMIHLKVYIHLLMYDFGYSVVKDEVRRKTFPIWICLSSVQQKHKQIPRLLNYKRTMQLISKETVCWIGDGEKHEDQMKRVRLKRHILAILKRFEVSPL